MHKVCSMRKVLLFFLQAFKMCFHFTFFIVSLKIMDIKKVLRINYGHNKHKQTTKRMNHQMGEEASVG